jgi:TolB-like protein/DNA-binding winged helix-turn-helix (wHTH) protein
MRRIDLSDITLRFGDFEADLRTGELTKLGKRVRLQEQPFQLLALLLDKPGVLVTREELQLALWPETADANRGINKAISKIREALGDSADNPRFIETFEHRGYRFLANVTVVDPADPPMTVIDSTPRDIPTVDLIVQQTQGPFHFVDASLPSYRRQRPFAWWAVGIVTALVVFLSTIFYPRPYVSTSIHTVMVLPLQNVSRDGSQDFFASGMTDELITELLQVKRLRVISYGLTFGEKETFRPLRDIARESRVDAVMKGTVLLSGDRIRINARLIDVPTQQDVWAQSYEGDTHDTLKIQSQIASEIVAQFRAIMNQQEQAPLEPESDAEGRTKDWLKQPDEQIGHAVKQAADYHRSLAENYAPSDHR